MSIYFPTTTNALYGDGPASFHPSGIFESMKRSALPGVDYHITLKMGKRRRRYVQRGWLITASEASMDTLLTNIDNNTGSTGTLQDNYGDTYASMTLVGFTRGPETHRSATQWEVPYAAVYDRSGQ